eukprot:3265862-Rhodomonas_salina.2
MNSSTLGRAGTSVGRRQFSDSRISTDAIRHSSGSTMPHFSTLLGCEGSRGRIGIKARVGASSKSVLPRA